MTWSGSAATDPLYAAATYGYVLQSAPIYDTDAAFSNAATPNPINLNVNGLIRAVGIGVATAGNDGSYTWGQATETTDQTRNVTVTVSTAEGVFPSTGPVISGATHSGPNRQAIAGIVLTPD